MKFKNILKGVDPSTSEPEGDSGDCFDQNEFDSVSKEAMLDIRASALASGMSEDDLDLAYPLPTE